MKKRHVMSPGESTFKHIDKAVSISRTNDLASSAYSCININ